MKTITVKLPDHLDAALERTATRSRKSKSAVVRHLLERALPLDEAPVAKGPPTLHDQLAKYQVAGGTGVPDLSSNPEHLSDYGR